ncbi:MAG: GNAT family N-acetyltransferase [bacterium]|nr:GNAT family N-acetyltransferase [bacterium]
MEPEFISEPLGEHHDRAAFVCGVESLDRYIKHQATQDIRRHLAAVHVFCETSAIARTATGLVQVAGFYTLSALSIYVRDLPASIAKRMPRYPLPVTLLGRLARDVKYRGHGLGNLLLYDAIEATVRVAEQIASIGLVVDAENDSALRFYERHGFEHLTSAPKRLILRMETMRRLV